MSSQQKRIPPTKYTKFDPTRVVFSKVEKNERTKAQKISFPRYTHPKYGETSVVVQSPFIQLTQYGIPSLGEFYKDDNDRAFIKVPFDLDQEECAIWQKKWTEFDKLASKKFKSTILGKNASKYQYTHIVRTPQVVLPDDDDDEELAKKSVNTKPKFKYLKVKIDTEYETGKVKTLIYRKLSKKEAEEKGMKRELVPVETITDVANIVRFNSKIRLIVMVNKVWAANAPDKSGTYGYGVGLKALQIEVEPGESSMSVKANYSQDAFVDDESEKEEEEEVKPTKAKHSSKSKQPTLDEDDSEEEEEEIKPTKAKHSSKSKQPILDEDDSEEEEEEEEEEELEAVKENLDNDAKYEESEEEVKPNKKKKNKKYKSLSH